VSDPSPEAYPPPAVAGVAVEVQRRLESFYALPAQAPVADFLIAPDRAAHLPGEGSRTLVDESGGELSLGVVLEAQVSERLQAEDPRQGLSGSNLGQFCTLVEEVSHFVCLSFCAGASRSVTQLELELQAEVDKYFNLVFLLSLQNEGAVSPGLKELLFRSYRLRGGLSAEQARRYHAASGLAYRYCRFLEAEYLRPARLHELRREARRFYRLGQGGKLERISATRA